MKIKKNYPLIIAPILTIIILSTFFDVYDIFPFGSKTISWCDLNQQTVPLLMDLKDILDGKSSVLYSTGNAGGMNFWGVFLFFIASPLYLSVKFVEKSDIIYLVNILFAIKLSLCALTTAIYLKTIHKKLNNSLIVILSVMYALCGYGIMYCQTLVWLDIMALFPILVLGIEKMCSKNSPYLYGIVLSFIIIINFYLSYMIVLYILISVPLFIHIRCDKNKRQKIAISFICSSSASLLITAPVWLCALLQIYHSARGKKTVADLMYKSFFENGANKFSVIMCTGLFIAILLFFIKNKIVQKPEIKHNILLALLLIIPIFIDPVNKLWHMGSYQSFPLRYGFIVIFTLLTLTAHYFEHIENYGNTSKAYAITIGAMTCGFIVLCIYIVHSKKTILSSYINTLKISKNSFKLLFTIFFLGYMMYIICIMLERKKLLSKKIFCLLIFSIFLGETYTSFSVNIGYAANYGEVFKNSSVLEHDSSGEVYYRTKNEKKYLHVNMLGGLGYNSMAHYTSLTSEDYMFTMKKLGYSSYWMEVGANGGTAFTDAILGIKYLIGASEDFKSYHDIKLTKGDLYIAESKICCPIGIISDKTPNTNITLKNERRIDTQKKISENIFGTSKMFYEYQPVLTAEGSFEYKDSKYNITPSKQDLCQLRYTINVSGKQILYFDLFDRLSNNLSEDYYGSAKIYVNGQCINSDYPNQKNNGILSLGEFENTSVEILIIIQKDISVKSFGVFGIDIDSLKNNVEKICLNNSCEMYADGRKIIGQCYSKNNQWLYMSIPFERGLKAYVNNKRVPIIKFNDNFCAIKLDSGKNSIRLEFTPSGMITGLILSFLGLVLIIFFRTFGKEKLYKIYTLKKFSVRLCSLMFILVILLIYILPVTLRLAVIISDKI